MDTLLRADRAAARRPVRQRRGVPVRAPSQSARCTVGPRRRRPSRPIPVPAAPNVNPFVAHLQTLYSQSPVSNAGTRGDGRVRHLRDDGTRRAPDPGRARRRIPAGHHHGQRGRRQDRVPRAPCRGGGRARRTARRAAGQRHGRAAARRTACCAPTTTAARTRATGPTTTCYSSSSRPFADGSCADADETRLIAINDGRLVDFLTAREDQFAALARASRARGSRASRPPKTSPS